jgi:hypothetical protein
MAMTFGIHIGHIGARVNIAFRDCPYDWDALRAVAEDVVAKS